MFAAVLAILIAHVSSFFYSTSVAILPQQHPLPLSLTSLLLTHQVQSFQLVMGHLTHRFNTAIFSQGIIMRIYTQHQPSEEALSQISSALGVSQRSGFRLWDPEINATTISDPNDRLCNEQIESLLTLFLPCRNWGSIGLNHLVCSDKVTSNYLGIKLEWSRQKTSLFLIKQQTKQDFINQYRETSVCGQIRVEAIEPNDAGVTQPISIQRLSISKWYSPSKTMALIIPPTSFTNTQQTLTYLTILPTAFSLKQIQVVQGSSTFQSSSRQHADLSRLITINITLPIKEQLVIHVRFDAGLPLFQTFETISGGGQEFLGLVQVRGGKGVKVETSSAPFAMYLLQPDFSINFLTITACSAVILIFWLGLWRSHNLVPQKSELQDQ